MRHRWKDYEKLPEVIQAISDIPQLTIEERKAKFEMEHPGLLSLGRTQQKSHLAKEKRLLKRLEEVRDIVQVRYQQGIVFSEIAVMKGITESHIRHLLKVMLGSSKLARIEED